MSESKLQDEFARLAALHRYDVLDTPPDEPFDKITALVQTILNVPISAVSLVDRDRQWFKSCVGLDVRETSRDISFCTHAIRSRRPMAVEDAFLDERFAENPLVTGKPFVRSYLGVPLETPDGYNVGSLCALDTKPRRYDEKQIEVLKSFAAVVVDELELLSLVRTDQLTGAASRRAFVEDVAKAAARFDRHGRESALIMFDIDHFKRINDTYGHPAGDKVLRAVGACCTSLARTQDSFGRVGGEEFALLLSDSSLEGALQTAERFREALAGLVIAHDPPIGMTASFGVAVFSPSCRTGEAIMAEADRGLYLAKHAGRNRCCVAEAIPA
jgi:diguanylate cyclase (GGDEF)-like protein